MSQWGSHQTVVSRLQRMWDSGRLLSERLARDGESLFPLRIPLKKPGAKELDNQFDQARQWVAQLQQASQQHGYSLVWKTIKHRVHGQNNLPVAVIIDTPERALRLVRKQKEAERFDAISQLIVTKFPVLHGWLRRKPLTALRYATEWPRLMSVMSWLRDHPQPGIYVRQIDLPGVHTKFIEAHRGLLIELLDQALPARAINRDSVGVRGFESRYGFLSKPTLVRFRFLDQRHCIQGLSDLTIPIDQFRQLSTHIKTVLVTENDINGLAMPPIEDALVILGLGYGLDALKQINWLARKRMIYWGDLDTHGFVMLDQLRHTYPDAQSILMDEATLLEHQSLWGTESKPLKRELSHLSNAEQGVYQALVTNRYQTTLRLEQERIRFGWIKKYLADTDLNQL